MDSLICSFVLSDKPIHLGILVPLTGTFTSALATLQSAAALAVQRVNTDTNLLAGQEDRAAGRYLKYSIRDSGCSAKQGLRVMGDLLGGDISAVTGHAGWCWSC